MVAHPAPRLIMSAICTASSDLPTFVSANRMHISCSYQSGPQSCLCIPDATAWSHQSLPDVMRVTLACGLCRVVSLHSCRPVGEGGREMAGRESSHSSMTDEMRCVSPFLSERASAMENRAVSLTFTFIFLSFVPDALVVVLP